MDEPAVEDASDVTNMHGVVEEDLLSAHSDGLLQEDFTYGDQCEPEEPVMNEKDNICSRYRLKIVLPKKWLRAMQTATLQLK